MSLAPGTALGSYKIVSAIGAGGMGEVYRATDTRLGRDVALKVLPASFANDPDRRARFEREAQALAALNHFNIAQIYGLEGDALVMELLEGQTLRDRLNSGPLTQRKAIEYGAQIARGLAAAHDRGIIHRDLKPENIFIVTDGSIKILDFGLARLEPSGHTHTASGHLSTAPGAVMGTAGYMSPEQVRGLPVDARSDLFSLGAVLYELLSGQRAFRRDSAAETMTAILNEQPPDLLAVRADIGPALDRIVQHCLEKNPIERFQSARDVAFALDSLSGSATATTTQAARRGFPTERLMWAVITGLLLTALAWTLIDRPVTTDPAPPSRGLVVLPEGVVINDVLHPGSRLVAAPDGKSVMVFGRHLNTGRAQLFLLPLDGSAATAFPDSSGLVALAWATDSRSAVAFGGTGMSRLALDGTPPILITQQPIGGYLGAAVNAAGDVLTGGPAVQRIQIKGGVIEDAIGPRASGGFFSPTFLADGQRFLAGHFDPAGDATIQSARLGSKESVTLLAGADIGKVVYASGAVIYSRGDSVFAHRVEGDPLRLVGDPVALAQSVEVLATRGAAFSVSNNGVLVYQAQESRPLFRLTWIDRAGKVIATVGEEADYSNVELSPDGRRVMASVGDARLRARDIVLIDVNRGISQRFTNHPSDERAAVWSPDGKRIAYNSKGLDLYVRNSDSSGEESALLADGASKDPYDWSPDGRWIVYRVSGRGTGNDLWIMSTDGSNASRALVATPASDLAANFSPDGHRIVYTSEETGQTEVYVVNVDGGGKTQISSNGGLFPRWRPDGKEIFYVSTDRVLMSALVTTGPAFEVAAPRPLFSMNVVTRPGPVYDVSPDGQRFLVATPVPSRIPPSINVLTNWPSLLRN
jgi:WD40 repeat protein/predicted Ser/Thr protein kinase